MMEFGNYFMKEMHDLEKRKALKDDFLKKTVFEMVEEMDEIPDDIAYIIDEMNCTEDDSEMWYCIHLLADSIDVYERLRKNTIERIFSIAKELESCNGCDCEAYTECFEIASNFNRLYAEEGKSQYIFVSDNITEGSNVVDSICVEDYIFTFAR